MKMHFGYVLLVLVVARQFHGSPVLAAESFDTPPMAGQPLLFNGDVGAFHVTMRAEPTELRAGETLVLTIQLQADAPAAKPPRRPNLRRRPAFAERFFIEPSSTDLPDRTAPDQQGWEFDYRLRPKNETVKSVPNFRFDYYKPGFLPAEKGYQTSWAYAVPLRVKPAEVVPIANKVANEDVRNLVDAALAEIRRGPDVYTSRMQDLLHRLTGATLGRDLTHKQASGRMRVQQPHFILLFGVPILCAGLIALCRKLLPDARQTRRAGAVRRALRALRRVRSTSNIDQSKRVLAIVTDLLTDCFGWKCDEVTSSDLGAALLARGCPRDVVEKVTAYVQAFELARYGPPGAAPLDWRAEGCRLVRSLEDAP